jgi:hypothetical protein
VTSTQHSSHRPRIRAGIVAVVAVVAGMLAFASYAIAAAPPHFSTSSTVVSVYPTRAHVNAMVQIPYKLATKLISEYAPAEANGEAPAEGSPAWTVLNELKTTGNEEGEDEEIRLGTEAAGMEGGLRKNTYVRHLLPDTAYYARFIAENKEGRGVETVPFRTLALAPPEISPIIESNGTAGPGRFFEIRVESATVASPEGFVESNGSETSYSVEYSLSENGHEPAVNSASWKLFAKGSGTITPAAEYAKIEAQATGLAPETSYYVRLRASNAYGKLIQTKYWSGTSIGEFSTFTTFTAKPGASVPGVRNVTATSAYVSASVAPHGFAMSWRLESSSSPSGPWAVIPGSAGSVSQAVVESLPYDSVPYAAAVSVGARFSGLSASSSYYVRLVAENQCAQGCGGVTSTVGSFVTSGAPSATTFMVHTLDGESLRLLGTVNPNSELTTAEQVIALHEASGGSFTLTFKGQTTGPIAYNASALAVDGALARLEGHPKVNVDGVPGGPYTVWFAGAGVQGAQPLIEADGLGLAPPGTVSVAVTQQGGEAYDAHYRFRYVSQKSFEAHGWSEAQETSEVDGGSGTSVQLAGADLPGLMLGETYRYRLVANSNAPGTGVVEGSEQSLVVPEAPAASESGSCANEAFRTGLSSHLPDCRAYEMVTPVDKKGAQEPFHYGGGIQDAALAGMDGEHVAVEAFGVFWPGSGTSPYFFSRMPGGWSMVAGSPQPETGVYYNAPELYSADLGSFAFRSSYQTAPGQESATVEYKVGRAGGPYKTVASVPRVVQGSPGWVAGTADLSKLVFATTDRTLISEEPTPTKSGPDLYEYTAEGGLRQLNVAGEGNTTIGRCGASMVSGEEGLESRDEHGSPHSISADGSRVFFEAVPGSNCSEAKHLYMRVNGTETVDIGAVTFERADAQGTTLLFKDSTGSLVGYDTQTREVQPEPSGEAVLASELAALEIPDTYHPQHGEPFHRPRYTTWGDRKPSDQEENGQAYRYDATAHLLVCMSCASSFDPQPKLPAFTLGLNGSPLLKGGAWEYRASSEDGRFAFFTTPAALVPQDIDGEIPNEYGNKEEYFNLGDTTSLSSDIYEWRAPGVDGCVRVQGCLALITDGRGGYYNLLLGSANEGRDVFIYTRSKLLPQDTDTSGDIYDARIGGGFAPAPPRPVECEGDACSTPPPAPNDATPSSLTFTGTGNVLPSSPSGKAVVRSKKPKRKHKPARKRKRAKRAGAHRSPSSQTHGTGKPAGRSK